MNNFDKFPGSHFLYLPFDWSIDTCILPPFSFRGTEYLSSHPYAPFAITSWYRLFLPLVEEKIHFALPLSLSYSAFKIPILKEQADDTYAQVSEWEKKAKKLVGMYIENFKQYCDNDAARALIAFGPQLPIS